MITVKNSGLVWQTISFLDILGHDTGQHNEFTLLFKLPLVPNHDNVSNKESKNL